MLINMKNIIIIFTCISISLLCISCNKSQLVRPDMDAQNECEDVLKYLENKDTKKLKEMFCEVIKTSQTLNLDNEINSAMDFFEGNIISYDRPLLNNGSTIKYGEYTSYDIGPSIDNIKTDSNQVYNIKFYSYIINNDYPNKIGVSQIDISSKNGEKYSIGDFYLVNPKNNN